MRILVTGASGFIGRRYLHHLQAQGMHPVGMGRRAGIAPPGWIMVSDYGLDAMREATRGMTFDGIVHLAAAGVHPSDREVASLIDGNALLPVAIVQLAAEVQARSVVVAGSSAEYAASQIATLDEHATLESGTLYGGSKAAGGLLALSVAATLGMPCAVLRLFNVFGPGEAPHRLLPSLHDSLRAGQPAALSAGTQVRDFVHVDDVCRAATQALAGLADGILATGAYNVATGIGHSVREFAQSVAQAMDKPASLLRFGALPMRPDDRPVLIGDASAFRAATGWAPALPFLEAVASSVGELNRGSCHKV